MSDSFFDAGLSIDLMERLDFETKHNLFKDNQCVYSSSSLKKRKLIWMFIISNFIEGIARVLDAVLTLYMFIVIAHAILSWVNPDPYNPIVRFIRQMVDPLLFQIRRRIPTVFGGIDISPIIILLAIIFLQSFFSQTFSHSSTPCVFFVNEPGRSSW